MSVDTDALRDVKEFKGLPLIQNFWYNRSEYKRDRIALFQKTFAACGDLGVFVVGQRRYYLASSVELAHELLVKHGDILDKPERFRTAMRPLLGDGLLAARNDLHARQRQLIQPSFRKKALLATSAQVAAEHAYRAGSTL